MKLDRSFARLVAAGAVCLLTVPALAQVLRNDGLPTPNPLFPDDNWWNRDVRCAPVDPNSTNFINFIGAQTGGHPDFGGDDGTQFGIYGMVYITVPGTQPRETVTWTEFGSQSDNAPPGMPGLPGYPIPVEARTQAKWIEGGQPGGGTSGDRHMLIVDRDNHILYELYHARWNAAANGGAGRWEAGSGAIFLLDRNGRRPETWTSADAAGLAILPGLVRYDEVFGPDPEIRHAFRMTTDFTRSYVFPASHDATTSGNVNALPLGARLRLKASKDISGFPAYVQKIFRAMKTYGLILADNGSDMYVQGTYDTRWDNDVLNPAFAALKASDFEVLQLGWDARKGDFNCQGQVDVLFDYGPTDGHMVWYMNGVTRASQAILSPDLNPGWTVVGTDDFNLDSHTDLLTWNGATGALEFWLMNGATRTGSPVALSGVAPLSTQWRVAATGDFDHDGWPDLIWRNISTQKLVVWTLNGTAYKSAIVPNPDQAVDSNWSVVAALDLDGDLNTDLLWYNSTTGKIVRWLMNANVQRISGAFTNPTNAGDNNWQVVASGDYGVGAAGVAGTKDLVWRNATSGKLVAWYMDLAGNRTSGVFTSPDAPSPALDWTVVGPK